MGFVPRASLKEKKSRKRNVEKGRNKEDRETSPAWLPALYNTLHGY